MSAYDFAYYVKDKMNIKMARLITADNQKPITTVGFICGDGGNPFKINLGMDWWILLKVQPLLANSFLHSNPLKDHTLYI
mgnify:CR=1 FL=1